MKKVPASLFVLSFILLFTAGMPVASLGPVPATVETITPGELRMHLEFLASDELGGRATLAPNFAIAARYLATNLKAYGFRGMGEHGDFSSAFRCFRIQAGCREHVPDPHPGRQDMEF